MEHEPRFHKRDRIMGFMASVGMLHLEIRSEDRYAGVVLILP